MASTRRPRVSQISWPVPTSVVIAAKRIGSVSIGGVAEMLFEPRGEPAAADQPAAGEADVEIAEDAALGQAARPVLEHVEPAGGVAAADHGADRRADDDVGLDAVREQRADHADMGKAARAAAAERKPDRRTLGARAACVGRRFGAAVAVSSACPRSSNTSGVPIVAATTIALALFGEQAVPQRNDANTARVTAC